MCQTFPTLTKYLTEKNLKNDPISFWTHVEHNNARENASTVFMVDTNTKSTGGKYHLQKNETSPCKVFRNTPT